MHLAARGLDRQQVLSLATGGFDKAMQADLLSTTLFVLGARRSRGVAGIPRLPVDAPIGQHALAVRSGHAGGAKPLDDRAPIRCV